MPGRAEAEASHLPEFHSFAKGIHQDKAAVLAGLTLPWSQGPLEGHVNRLKLLKRSMYGRAKLPLVRARVLHVDGSAKPMHAKLGAAG
jgi:transposase